MERKETVAIIAACIIGGALIGVTAVGMAYALSDTIGEEQQETVTEPGTITLTPCDTEDSHDCYWDAATMGNGTGTSFIDIDGVLYFPEMR